MAEYDVFAETYQHWTVTSHPYGQIESYNFFRVLGNPRGLRVLDLAAGEGRISRILMKAGAAWVLGTDLSPEMVRRAEAQNDPEAARDRDEAAETWSDLSYRVLDARDSGFQLEILVDLVSAGYLFHYAESTVELDQMADLISRNLKPGGRFVTYTISPDADLLRDTLLLEEHCGFSYERVDSNHYHLIIDDNRVDMWQWSREDHEASLRRAGLMDIRWHPLQAPPDSPVVEATMKFYLANPSCIVLSARKPE